MVPKHPPTAHIMRPRLQLSVLSPPRQSAPPRASLEVPLSLSICSLACPQKQEKMGKNEGGE